MFTAIQAKHANYACAALSLVILFIRLVVSHLRKKPFDLSFFLVVASIFVIIGRIIVVYYYLLFGTASDALGNEHYFDIHDAHNIKKGSILSLVARVFITSSCWLQIGLLLLFYSHMMYGIRWVARTITFTWVATIASFIAIVLATFLECRPFHLYWQVVPDPGNCVKSYAQIFIQCVANIFLDLLLLVISYPIIATYKGRSWKQHLRIAVLFCLGTFCIIVAALRLVSILDSRSAQPTRSLWASVQMVVSTFVANTPTIYGDLQVVKRKKDEVMLRRASRPELFAHDAEAAFPGRLEPCHNVQMPARVATTETRASQSTGSTTTTKEWFDHLEWAK